MKADDVVDDERPRERRVHCRPRRELARIMLKERLVPPECGSTEKLALRHLKHCVQIPVLLLHDL